ncbi:hypothetical protein KEM48_014046 [Puccinia striiformis f. sp. tritici PST-130]|nr:hypothetical protein KEM48_014046 [Puccinia striiformis f. sp. tritici PST-130]
MGYIVYDRVEGTKIEWKEGKDLIRERVIKPKKQRNQDPDDEISMFGENIQIHRNRGDQQDWFQDLVDLSFSADSRLMASL